MMSCTVDRATTTRKMDDKSIHKRSSWIAKLRVKATACGTRLFSPLSASFNALIGRRHWHISNHIFHLYINVELEFFFLPPPPFIHFYFLLLVTYGWDKMVSVVAMKAFNVDDKRHCAATPKERLASYTALIDVDEYDEATHFWAILPAWHELKSKRMWFDDFLLQILLIKKHTQRRELNYFIFFRIKI